MSRSTMSSKIRPEEQQAPSSAHQPAEEPVFSAPWEGQAFAAAVALRDRAVLQWPEFADYLSKEIAAADAGAGAGDADYYRHWLQAMECLLLDKGLLTVDELTQRRDEVAAARRRDHNAGR